MSDPIIREFPIEEFSAMNSEMALHELIRHATDIQASDLFLHTNERSTDICIRRLGMMQRLLVVSLEQGRQLIGHVKAMADMDIAEHRRPMDGRWIHEDEGNRYDLRINSLATLFGEDMTIRLWDRQMGLRSIDELGLTREEIGTLKGMLSNPSGLILVTGPTGTGKTTTLYACLKHLNDGSRKISTLEDPIEFALSGVRQSQIQPKLGLDFPELLRNVLRQAPDVIMIGEIRDEHTAETAVRAANSGHLVLATLHAPVAAGAIQSLLALGSHPHFLSGSLLGVVAQRLIRTLCPSCRIAYDISVAPETFADIKSLLTADEGKVIYGPGQCDDCFNIGYGGRTGLFEILTMTRDLRQLISSARPTEDIEREAIRHGMLEFKRSAMLRVAKGVTSTEEILRDVPPEYLGLED